MHVKNSIMHVKNSTMQQILAPEAPAGIALTTSGQGHDL